jgi:hypothetical protein
MVSLERLCAVLWGHFDRIAGSAVAHRLAARNPQRLAPVRSHEQLRQMHPGFGLSAVVGDQPTFGWPAYV